ncbi:unnamed protein product [Urochloa humidicola]
MHSHGESKRQRADEDAEQPVILTFLFFFSRSPPSSHPSLLAPSAVPLRRARREAAWREAASSPAVATRARRRSAGLAARFHFLTKHTLYLNPTDSRRRRCSPAPQSSPPAACYEIQMEMEAVLPSGGSSRRRWSSRPPSSSRAAWTELRPFEGRGGPPPHLPLQPHEVEPATGSRGLSEEGPARSGGGAATRQGTERLHQPLPLPAASLVAGLIVAAIRRSISVTWTTTTTPLPPLPRTPPMIPPAASTSTSPSRSPSTGRESTPSSASRPGLISGRTMPMTNPARS